jgi:hypothetical protein
MLTFSAEKTGANSVEIKAGNAVKRYTLIYQPAKEDETAGRAVVSVEAFTIGGGYLIRPVAVDIQADDNGARLLERVLRKCGYSYEKTGTLDQNFYLAVLYGGALPLKAKAPDYLKSYLLGEGFDDFNEADDLYDGGLGEFSYTHGSGWMYCVNNKFPNVGFADYYPADGDVMRVQFTLAYGADIGGASPLGAGARNFYSVADKDELTKRIAALGYANIPDQVKETVMKLNASQDEVDEAAKKVILKH